MITDEEQRIMDYTLQAINLYMNNSDWVGYLESLKDNDRNEVFKECEKLLGGNSNESNIN